VVGSPCTPGLLAVATLTLAVRAERTGMLIGDSSSSLSTSGGNPAAGDSVTSVAGACLGLPPLRRAILKERRGVKGIPVPAAVFGVARRFFGLAGVGDTGFWTAPWVMRWVGVASRCLGVEGVRTLAFPFGFGSAGMRGGMV
jgi:hypothetical protein